MKKMATILGLVLISSTVFAGSKDLKIMNTLLNVGADSEQFMSQVHVGLDTVECAYSKLSKSYDCNMTDISSNNGNGSQLNITGRKAKSVYNLLMSSGAPSDEGMNKVFVSASSIRCQQAISEVMDGSAAQRTSCVIELTKPTE